MKKNRGYQYNFSEILHKQMYDQRGRERKAKTIVTVLMISLSQVFMVSHS